MEESKAECHQYLRMILTQTQSFQVSHKVGQKIQCYYQEANRLDESITDFNWH